MKKATALFNIVLVSAGLLGSEAHTASIQITVENLAPTRGTLLTPIWIGFHNGSFRMFTNGSPASAALESLAEDGDTGSLDAAFNASGAGTVSGTIASAGTVPPLEPGERATMAFTLDERAESSRFLSYASMVIPSNDAFIANENPMALQVFDPQGNFVGGTFLVAGDRVWDAGTEVNDEAAMNTAFLGQMTPNTGVTEGGVVHPHPGFNAAGMGGILDGTFAGFTFDRADFKGPNYQVLRITVSRPVLVTVIAENTAPHRGTYLTPFWFGFHDGAFDAFTSGQAASPGLERVAEDGNTEVLARAFLDSGAGTVEATVRSNGPMPPLAPSQRAVHTFELDPLSPASRYLSYASMVIPSNDAFISNDNPTGIPVFDPDGNFIGGTRLVTGAMVWDAGTEVNDEASMNTAFLAQMDPNTGAAEGGVVHPHPGFKSVGMAGILDMPMFANADFTVAGYSVARLTLTLAPFITGISREGEQVRVTWTGGKAPFMVERRDNVRTGNWTEAAATSDRTVLLPPNAAPEFFRIREVLP